MKYKFGDHALSIGDYYILENAVKSGDFRACVLVVNRYVDIDCWKLTFVEFIKIHKEFMEHQTQIAKDANYRMKEWGV